jgi:ABC-type polysaccharide/polyol phosphate transport system ATPase subunit
MTSITATALGVRFRFDVQNRVVTPMMARVRRSGGETWGLRDLDIEIGAGESVALLGPSGSGKTTLLRTIAGVLPPDAGWVEVRGRVLSLLSIEAGLLGVLTGRENAILLGVVAGLTRQQAFQALPQIRERSGLGLAFDRPVSSLSQGMRARLSFAAGEQAAPSILLLDEVHEAFDHEFRGVVEEQARALLRRGGIVVAAGHDHAMLARLCTRAIFLREGAAVADGSFARVRHLYVGEKAG